MKGQDMSKFKRLVIIGGTGFVGRSLAKHLRPHFPEVGIWCLARRNDWRFSPDDLVVNAAGYKDVVGCENNSTYAYEANAILAGSWSHRCKVEGAKFVHISSDHAYATPRTVYGDSKRLGDELVRRDNPDAIIAVTGHVYDVGCPWVNWLDGELRAGNKTHGWRIFNYPTYAGHLTAMILSAVNCGAWGRTFDMTGGWKEWRADLFRKYAAAFSLDERLIPAHCPDAPSHYPRDFKHEQFDRCGPTMSPSEGFHRMKEEILENATASDLTAVESGLSPQLNGGL